MKNALLIVILSTVLSTVLITCTSDKGIPDYNGYPDDIGKIIYNKCATPGCHNNQSKGAAGDLSLESWDKLFEGGRNSATVIPFRHDYSTFFYYTNTYADLGVRLFPTMPYQATKLTREEIVLLRDWINAGAPDRNGFVKFSDNPNRKKYYVTNQGCDVVTVIDQATQLPMRYIDIGSEAGIEAPHMLRVSPDGQYWYVLNLAGKYLEKYRTSDDHFVARAFIGSGNWNAFTISDNSQTAYCTSLEAVGKIAVVNLSAMTATVSSGGGFSNPHGISFNPSQDTLYIVQQIGSILYKFPIDDFSTFTSTSLSVSPQLNIHEIVFSPDGSKYFLTCQGTDQVRIYATATDQLLATIAVGNSPTEMAFSTTTDYMFVCCTEDTTTFSGKRGSVAVINYQNNQLVKFIYTGHQPHGIAVDEAKKQVVIANRNFASDGPAPHHSGECGGRNGNVSFIDINTLSLVLKPENNTPKRIEVSVDPYSVGIRK